MGTWGTLEAKEFRETQNTLLMKLPFFHEVCKPREMPDSYL